MSVGIYIDKEHKSSELDIYAYVEIGDDPGQITKLEDGLTPVLHGTKLRLSYDPACQDQIVGRVESYLHPHEGGRFTFEQPENDILVDDIEAKRVFGWVYMVGARWLPADAN